MQTLVTEHPSASIPGDSNNPDRTICGVNCIDPEEGPDTEKLCTGSGTVFIPTPRKGASWYGDKRPESSMACSNWGGEGPLWAPALQNLKTAAKTGLKGRVDLLTSQTLLAPMIFSPVLDSLDTWRPELESMV